MATTKNNMLFDVLKNILTEKSKDIYQTHISNIEQFRSVSSFMLLRYLSMCQNSKVRDTVLTNYIFLERMPTTVLYKWLLGVIPRQKSSFIQYIR